jgi:hypothetical protein
MVRDIFAADGLGATGVVVGALGPDSPTRGLTLRASTGAGLLRASTGFGGSGGYEGRPDVQQGRAGRPGVGLSVGVAVTAGGAHVGTSGLGRVGRVGAGLGGWFEVAGGLAWLAVWV